MRIGLFPGTFNPIHIGHIQALQAVAKAFSLQRLIVIPAYSTPHKGAITSSDRIDRWQLLTSSLSNTFDVPVSTLASEINSEDCSYTAETVELIRFLFPSSDLFLIIGEDHYSSIDAWFRSDSIINNTNIIVVKRNDLANNSNAHIQERAHFAFIESVAPISSSAIRDRCASGQMISGSIPDCCEYELYASGIYLPESLKNEIRFVRSHQKPHRFKHTIGVVKTALRLASRFDIDPLVVVEAAYLHDIAKDLPDSLMHSFASCCSSDLGQTDIFPVLHAPAGAELALRLFSVDPYIYNAILKHCTLDTDMSLLDKIIYISDMIEPSRHYPAVYELRKVFDSVNDMQSLNSLLALAIDMNICYISNIGGTVHPASLRALAVLQNTNSKEILWNQKKQS